MERDLSEFLDKVDAAEAENLESVYLYDRAYDEGYADGYKQAVDDVMKKAKEIQEEQIKNLEQSPMRNGKRWAAYMNTYLGHIQVACEGLITEKLKGGAE